MSREWILVASEEHGKIFQKSQIAGLSCICTVRHGQECVKAIADFINENKDRFQFLTIIFPPHKLRTLHQYLKQEVLEKITANMDEFF